jgi:hypothetical protein
MIHLFYAVPNSHLQQLIVGQHLLKRVKRQLIPIGVANAAREEMKETRITGASIFSVYNSTLTEEKNETRDAQHRR